MRFINPTYLLNVKRPCNYCEVAFFYAFAKACIPSPMLNSKVKSFNKNGLYQRHKLKSILRLM
ncbi:hypothetical protein JCM19297_3110 [Nonlabens ulvanivorans]|nr:hypothetical protein JCM19297_3110 [Nonlabens ulvanivorans]